MKLLLAFCLAATTLMACVSGTERIARFSPGMVDSLKSTSINLRDLETRYGKYDGVFLVSEQTIENAADAGGWWLYKMKTLKYVVLNPDAEWLTTFNVEAPYDNSLRDATIQIMAPDGTIQQFTKKDLKAEKSSNSSTTFKLAYPNIKKGSIVQESYEIAYRMTSLSDFRQDIALQHSVPCERLLLQYIFPREWELKLKEIAPNKVVPYTTTVNNAYDKIILSYQLQDIPPVPDESYSPFFKEIGNYVDLMVTKFQVVAGKEVSPPGTWDELAEEFKSFAVDKGSFWSSKLESTVENITEKSTDNMQKLDTILSFVQQNVKVGSSSDNDNFADVLKKGEGDPFMITGLTRAMLQEAEIQSEYLLVHSAYDGYFDQNYVSAEQLMIPAVSATIAGNTYVMFPYIKNLPMDLIPDYLQGQAAMRITPDGLGGFTTVPTGSATDNIINETYDLAIDEEGLITVSEQRMLRGSNAYWTRRALEDLKEDELRKELKDMLTYSEGDVKLTSYEIENLRDYKMPLMLNLRYTIDNLVTVTPDEVIVQTGGLFSPATNRKTKIDSEDRRNPIRIYYPEELNKKITISHPPSWNLETKLETTQMENVFGTIKADYVVENGGLGVRHHRSLKRASQPKEKADELLAVMGRGSRLNVPALVFKVQPQTPATTVGSQK